MIISNALHVSDEILSKTLFIFCCFLFVFLAWLMSPFVPDDSYITFRYAENLANGNGITFNAGAPPVEGYTNFLWLIVLSLVAALGFELVASATIIGVAFGLTSIAIVWILLRKHRLTATQQIIPLLVLSSSGPFVLYAVSGMETMLFSVLLLLAVLCLYYVLHNGGLSWHIALSLSCLALALTRPEGVILYPIIFSFIIIIKYNKMPFQLPREISAKQTIIAATLFALLIIAYNTWRINYFGEVFPTPFLSKGAGGNILGTWLANLRYYFVVQNHYFSPLGFYYFSLLLLGLMSLLAFYFENRKFQSFETIVFVATLAFVAVYFNFVDWMPGMRYHAPLVPLVVLSCTFLFSKIELFRSDLPFSRLALGMIGVSAVMAINLSFLMELRLDAVRNERSTQRSLVELGEWMRANVSENTILAMSDVGATPYYSGLPTFDINPRSLTDVHIAKAGWSSDYFFERAPGLVVFVSFSRTDPRFYREHLNLFANADFLAQYRLIGITRYDWYHDRSYWIYAHSTLEFSDEQLGSIPRGIGG